MLVAFRDYLFPEKNETKDDLKEVIVQNDNLSEIVIETYILENLPIGIVRYDEPIISFLEFANSKYSLSVPNTFFQKETRGQARCIEVTDWVYKYFRKSNKQNINILDEKQYITLKLIKPITEYISNDIIEKVLYQGNIKQREYYKYSREEMKNRTVQRFDYLVKHPYEIEACFINNLIGLCLLPN